MNAHGNPVRILVVDDEPDIVESMTDLLQSFLEGVRVEQALNGEDALQVLREGHVDLILTDFMMPGMNGVQFLRAAQDIAPGTPNILVSAYELEHIKRAGKPEPQRILSKPFGIAEFQGAVEHALATSA